MLKNRISLIALTSVILITSALLAQDSTKAPVKAPAKDTTKSAPKDTTAVAKPKDTTKSEMTPPHTIDSSAAVDSTKKKTALERAQERAKVAAEKLKAASDTAKKSTGATAANTDTTKGKTGIQYLKKPTGVEYFDVKVGDGAELVMNDKVVCHYTVWFSDKGERGKKLQSSHDTNQPFACQLGVGVIPGWSDGMVGMKPGGIRDLRVPYSQAWGEQGVPNAIPGRTDILFEIEYIEPCTDGTCVPDPDPRMRGMLKYVGPKK